eukprot:jgi/Mesen1/4399/ME000225S03389
MKGVSCKDDLGSGDVSDKSCVDDNSDSEDESFTESSSNSTESKSRTEMMSKDLVAYEAVEKLIGAGQVAKLKVAECKLYLRKHELRMSGLKAELIARIQEHLELTTTDAIAAKYATESFVRDCTGDVCRGDIVLFEQNVFDVYMPQARAAKNHLGTRTIAGRIVKESYGAEKQQHTFTVEVLWSRGERALPPLKPLLIKGRNLYRLRTRRQLWADEGERRRVLDEKHARGDAARRVRAEKHSSTRGFPVGSRRTAATSVAAAVRQTGGGGTAGHVTAAAQVSAHQPSGESQPLEGYGGMETGGRNESCKTGKGSEAKSHGGREQQQQQQQGDGEVEFEAGSRCDQTTGVVNEAGERKGRRRLRWDADVAGGASAGANYGGVNGFEINAAYYKQRGVGGMAPASVTGQEHHAWSQQRYFARQQQQQQLLLRQQQSYCSQQAAYLEFRRQQQQREQQEEKVASRGGAAEWHAARHLPLPQQRQLGLLSAPWNVPHNGQGQGQNMGGPAAAFYGGGGGGGGAGGHQRPQPPPHGFPSGVGGGGPARGPAPPLPGAACAIPPVAAPAPAPAQNPDPRPKAPSAAHLSPPVSPPPSLLPHGG